MASERNPNSPLEDDAPGSTLRAVPRLGVPAAPPAGPVSDPGGTMVGLGRVPMKRVVIPVTPPPKEAPESGSTMLGLGRVQIGGPRPAQPLAPVTTGLESGGTMVGIARPTFGGALAPNFGNLAMPVTRSAAETARSPGMTPPAVPPFATESGGTMVGLARVGAPNSGAFNPLPSGVGGTMVGMARVDVPASLGFASPARPPDLGGTMVGIGRVGAAPAVAFAPPEDSGTMVGISPIAGFSAPTAAFGAAVHPVGPPPEYEILAHLGGGDLGEVYQARRAHDGAEVALRVIHPEVAEVPGAIDALRDVVALAANAQHTHLGKQYELDETASPTLVLEYVPGKQLASLMKERGLAPAAAVIDLGVRLCSALAAAHAAGLAHGRVHAGNVVLEAKTGRWVMLDLGHGYAVQGLEPAHDLYALGSLLYEMATGHSPFESGDQPPDPRSHRANLPASLSALLLRTTSPNPAVWFGSAIELAQALSRARNLP
jgi:hypothetical protein